jgi:large subunit ribosomal protein L21
MACKAETITLELEMYAVITSGGKQYRVAEGDVLEIEKLEVKPGDKIEFDKVLLVANGTDIKIGAPYVKGAKVSGEIVKQGRGEKVEIIKFRRRKHYLKHQGHRQDFTAVKIAAISA